MLIKSLHITSFGGVCDSDIELSEGINLISGVNESGKSSVAMFIKFIFYGLSAKSSKNDRYDKSDKVSERLRWVNRETMQASGYITAEDEFKNLWRIERSLILSDNSTARERCRIINQTTGEMITGEEPGEYFFKVPEDVFISTCFISQNSAVKPELSVLESVIKEADSSDSAFSGAGVDLGGGIKRLENIRREIEHKNGGGGILHSLREQRAAALREYQSSAEKAEEILSLGTSLDDIKKRITELEAENEHYGTLFSSLDKIVLKRRLDALAQSENRLESIKKQLDALEASSFNDECKDALDEAERGIIEYDELSASYDELFNDFELPDDLSSIDMADEEPQANDAEADAARSSHLENDIRTKTAVAVALMTAAVLGAATFGVMYFFNIDAYSIPLIVTLGLIVIGIVFVVKLCGEKRELNDILDRWDAESSDDIEEIAAQEDQSRRTAEEKNVNLTEMLGAAKLKFDSCSDFVKSLATEAGLEHSESIYDTVEKLRALLSEVKEKKSSLASAAAKISGRLDALLEMTEGVDSAKAELEAAKVLETDIGKTAAALGAEEIKEASSRREFTENALKSALKRKSALEEKLLELGKLTRTPDEYESLISSLDSQIEEYTIRREACELAIKVIGESAASMRVGVIERLRESAAETIRNATKHENLMLDSTLTPSLSSKKSHLTSEILSRGTADITYLSLRRALVGEIFAKEKPALIFDESFSHIDIGRTKSFINALDGAGEQYLILTCREDEAKIAALLGANVIDM